MEMKVERDFAPIRSVTLVLSHNQALKIMDALFVASMDATQQQIHRGDWADLAQKIKNGF